MFWYRCDVHVARCTERKVCVCVLVLVLVLVFGVHTVPLVPVLCLGLSPKYQVRDKPLSREQASLLVAFCCCWENVK